MRYEFRGKTTLELRTGESIAEACYLEAWGWIGTERSECSEDIEA